MATVAMPKRGAMPGRERMRGIPVPGGFSMPLAIETMLMAASIVAAWVLSSVFVDPFWSIVANVNYLWMFTVFFRIEPRVTVLELPQFITRASSVVAMVFIEYGSDIPELGMTGTAGSYSSSYVFYMLLLYTSATIVFRVLVGPPGRMKPSPLTPLLDRYANFIGAAAVASIGLVICWLVVRGASTGFPLLQGVDRFLYRRMMGDKITVYALNFKYVLMFVLGMVTFQLPVVRPLKLAALAGAIVSTIVFFLFADKFFTQLVAISGFLAPYLYVHHEKVRRYIAWYILVFVAALTMVFSVTWYIYSNGGAMSTAATMQKLNGRMVGQGELWFLQAKIGAPAFRYDDDFVRRNVDILMVKEAEIFALRQSLGPNYFSNLYAPDKIRASLHRNAGTVSYTAALEPLGLMAFGWGGLALMQLVLGAMMTLSTGYLAYTIVSRSALSAAFAAYIWIQFRYFLAQGAPWVIFGIYPVRWLFLVIALEFGLYALGLSQRSNGRRPRGVPMRVGRHDAPSARR